MDEGWFVVLMEFDCSTTDMLAVYNGKRCQFTGSLTIF
jgi:hypothetical protein